MQLQGEYTIRTRLIVHAQDVQVYIVYLLNCLYNYMYMYIVNFFCFDEVRGTYSFRSYNIQTTQTLLRMVFCALCFCYEKTALVRPVQLNS